MIAWGSLEWASGRVTMKIIIVVLLVLMGVGMLVLAPIVNERISGIGFKPPQPTWSKQPAQEQTVSTAAVVRFMRVVGGLLILLALVIGLLWRAKSGT